jgi:ribose-phosphate pyrophosphokinase
MSNKDFRIFSGSVHPQLAAEISSELDTPLSKLTLKKFACGEIYVNLEDSVRGKQVFIVNTINRETVNENFMETFLLCDAAKRSFAKEVHVILPHFGYARQDKIHRARESISAKLMADLLVQSGADHLLTLHLHADQIQAFFDIPVDNLNAKHLFAKKIRDENLQNPVVVSPDAGGAKVAKKFADLINADLAILHKTRPDHNTAEINEVIGDVQGKTPVLIDDLVDTAGSVVGAKKALLEHGANEEVYLVATHPVFSGPAVERLQEANFHKILVANSLPLPLNANKLNIETISVAPLISHVIENILNDRSVSELYF